jgi:hypothetical protein
MDLPPSLGGSRPRSTREVEIEIGWRKLAVTVAVATGEQRHSLEEAGRARTFFADYQRKVEQIPTAILMPKT